jgi:SPP1 gp7 family putative phage head morphogenesis protein
MAEKEKPKASFWDARKKKAKDTHGPFKKGQGAEKRYAMQLRKIAREVGRIVDTYPPGDPRYTSRIMSALAKYADLITPWAEETARSVVEEINWLDAKAWKQAAKDMGIALKAEIATAPTGAVMREFMTEQVRLIRSLPLEAGQRVHKLTIEGLSTSARFKQIADEIAKTGKVTASRATLIARTETARTASALTMARAQHIGSDGYIWRTVGDTDVRPRHRKLNGKYFAWDNPPVAGEKGEHAHAGMIYNCRCYPEPVIPEI